MSLPKVECHQTNSSQLLIDLHGPFFSAPLNERMNEYVRKKGTGGETKGENNFFFFKFSWEKRAEPQGISDFALCIVRVLHYCM